MPDKKYYWLKLKQDFFKQKEIKKLRSIAGGDTFTIIYLKMQLLSLKNEGKLYFDGVEDDFISEMALELDEKTENVALTIGFLQKHGLLETITDDEFSLPEAKECMGKITDEGLRKRRYRNRDNVPQKRDIVPYLSKNVPPELEKEIELEKDKEIKKKKTPSANADSVPESSDYKKIVDFYFKTHEESKGEKPTWGKAEGAQLKRLLSDGHKIDLIIKKIHLYYYEPCFWFNKAGGQTFLNFIKHYSEIVPPVTEYADEKGRVFKREGGRW